MKTLTEAGLNKIANFYLDSLSHALYKLDGVDHEINFINKLVEGNTVKVYIYFEESYTGSISDIRIIDKDGEVVAKDPRVYERSVEKVLYVAFKHEFMEV